MRAILKCVPAPFAGSGVLSAGRDAPGSTAGRMPAATNKKMAALPDGLALIKA
jgi:hypothetical protein